MGVEWPDRREDVLNALDILASPDPSAGWPTLTDAVHWLVDDTFWDVRDPAEDIGALLFIADGVRQWDALYAHDARLSVEARRDAQDGAPKWREWAVGNQSAMGPM